jgi:LCP family protein required for cell wall assembly
MRPDRPGDDGAPPSFAPGGAGGRPDPQDAVVVGRQSASSTPPPPAPRTAGRTPPPARPARPVGSSATRPGAGTPPSFSPGSPAARAAAGAGTATGTPRGDHPAGSPAPVAPRSSSGRPTSARPPAATTTARPGGGRGGRDGAGPSGPAGPTGPTLPATPRTRHRLRWVMVSVAVVLVLLLAWPIGLAFWANGKLNHTDALSGADGTPGTTYLITGSDSRADGAVKDDGTAGERSDTVLLLHVPDSGPTALISLPRDTLVDIPGEGAGKLNAAFAYGGAPLLVETVEGLTGLTVDHYAEIGMAGVKGIVDAVGGVRLCYDDDVNDRDSHLKWKAGCHVVDGTVALQFARMRKADRLGDIGRAQRQRQLVGAVLENVDPKSIAVRPSQQVALINAATASLTVDESAGITDLARLALAFRAANGSEGITGTPPIADLDYRPGGVGSTVLLDPEETPRFFKKIRDGKLPPGKVNGLD